jgi:hypothetical protein
MKYYKLVECSAKEVERCTTPHVVTCSGKERGELEKHAECFVDRSTHESSGRGCVAAFNLYYLNPPGGA